MISVKRTWLLGRALCRGGRVCLLPRSLCLTVLDHARGQGGGLRGHSRLHSLVLMCPGSSSLGTASLQRGHFPNPSLLSHSVSRCSVRLDISTTCTQERRQGDLRGKVPQARVLFWVRLVFNPQGCARTLCRDPVSFCSSHCSAMQRPWRGWDCSWLDCLLWLWVQILAPSISYNVYINRIVPPV